MADVVQTHHPLLLAQMTADELDAERARLADLLASLHEKGLGLWPSLEARILELLLRSRG